MFYCMFYFTCDRSLKAAAHCVGAYVLSGTTASDVSRLVLAPGPTVSTVQRASTCPRTSSSASAPTPTSATPVSSSTPAGRRRALTPVGVSSNRAIATLAAADPATAALTAAFTTRVPAPLAFTAADVPPSQTPHSGQSPRMTLKHHLSLFLMINSRLGFEHDLNINE